MEIKNHDDNFMTFKQHSLKPVQLRTILKALPGVKDEGPSDDGKCTHQWCFLADGERCAIWDYKGTRWSGFGPREVFEKLGLI